MASSSLATVGTDIQALLLNAQAPGDSWAFFQAVYLDKQPTFQSQSPVAEILPPPMRMERHTMGAGVNRDIETWEIHIYIDRTILTTAQTYQQYTKAVEVVRHTFHQHVQLGDANPATTSILLARLDGQISQPGFRQIEGTLYRWFFVKLVIYEDYTTPIGV